MLRIWSIVVGSCGYGAGAKSWERVWEVAFVKFEGRLRVMVGRWERRR